MIVYKMTNMTTGLSYVGATTRELKARLWDHASSWKRGKTTLIAKAIRDYGMDAFKVEILCRVNSGSFDDLMNEEIKAIREHGTLEPHGLLCVNLATGTQTTTGLVCSADANTAASSAINLTASNTLLPNVTMSASTTSVQLRDMQVWLLN